MYPLDSNWLEYSGVDDKVSNFQDEYTNNQLKELMEYSTCGA
jgi:hypothetical protein